MKTKSVFALCAKTSFASARFTDILKESRIKTARFYLRCSDLPISDISALCGYTNRAFFYRTFEELCGMTPLEWREGKQDSG